MRQEKEKFAVSQQRCKIGPRLLLMTIRKSHTPFSIGAKINDLGWPWTADTHSTVKKMRLSEPNTTNEDKPYYQRQKCRPTTLCSGSIGLCGYSPGFSGDGASNDSGVVDNANFQCFSWLFLQHYYIAIRSPSLAFQWSQSAWPCMTLTGYFSLNSVFARFVRFRK